MANAEDEAANEAWAPMLGEKTHRTAALRQASVLQVGKLIQARGGKDGRQTVGVSFH